jgi:hypothetical protein
MQVFFKKCLLERFAMYSDMSSAAKLSIGSAVRFGCQTLQENLGFFIFVSLVLGLVSRIPALVRSLAHEKITLSMLDAIDLVLGYAIAVGLLRVALKLSRSEKAGLLDFLSSYSLVFRFGLGSLWCGLWFAIVWTLLSMGILVPVFILLPLFGASSPLPPMILAWLFLFPGAIGALIVFLAVRRFGMRAAAPLLVLGVLVLVTYLALPFIHLGGPFRGIPARIIWSILGGALGSVAASTTFLAFRGFVRLIEMQFFGHVMVDGGLGIRDSFRRSSSIARPARRGLFFFDLVLLGILGVVVILQYFLGLRGAGETAPGAIWSVLKEFILLGSWLITWPFLVAHALIYQRLVSLGDRSA